MSRTVTIVMIIKSCALVCEKISMFDQNSRTHCLFACDPMAVIKKGQAVKNPFAKE